jgi:phosphatidate phosphatase PAH1
VFDKAAEDEDVEVYECDNGAWRLVGRTRSDGEGHFDLALTGDDRLGTGLHELVISVPGDRSGAIATAYIAPRDAHVVLCDIDGTLTNSEDAIVGEVVWHENVRARPGAASALHALADAGYQPIYVTARSRAYTELTSRWLAAQEMPRGPVVVAPTRMALPGSEALGAKTREIAKLRAAGLDLAVGIGNRATDVIAYERAGIPGDRIWVQTSEHAAELAPLIQHHRAIGFTSYAELRARVRTLPIE